MGNCFKCFEKQEDEDQLINDEDDLDSFYEESEHSDGPLPPSERDEAYQRLQSALIQFDPPDILGRPEIEDKLQEYNDGLCDRIMGGIYVKEKTFPSPRRGAGAGDGPRSSETPEQRVVQNQGDQEEADEPEWEAMVKNIRDQIRSQGGTDKIEFIYSRNGN